MSSPLKTPTKAASPRKPFPLKNANPNMQSAPHKTATSRSSAWTKPNSIMAKYKARRTLEKLSGKRSRTDEENDSGIDSERSSDNNSSAKRLSLKNPFTRQTSDCLDSDIYSGTLPQALDFVEMSPLVEHLRLQERQRSVSTPSMVIEEHPIVKDSQEEKKAYTPYKDYFDWSLKTKLMITTTAELNFVKELNAQDRVFASSVTSSKLSRGARFLRQLKYWTFPNLHGVQTFPRSASSSAMGGSQSDWRKLMPHLQSEWDSALRELSAAVQLDVCPYFYIVTHQWTAVVVAKCVNKGDSIRAFVAPTNTGFRSTLREKGIPFSMPLRNVKVKNPADKDQDELNSSGGSDSLVGSSGTSWITEQCKKVGKVFVEDAVDVVEQELDNKPESLIAFEGAETVAFVEALLKARSLIPAGGPLLNVPPTLISPVAFTHASMDRLKHQFHRADGKSYVELSGGPILPQLIPSLITFLAEDVDVPCEFDRIHFTTHDSTSAFTRITVPEEKSNYKINPETHSVAFADVPRGGVADAQQVADHLARGHVLPLEVLSLMRSFPLVG